MSSRGGGGSLRAAIAGVQRVWGLERRVSLTEQLVKGWMKDWTSSRVPQRKDDESQYHFFIGLLAFPSPQRLSIPSPLRTSLPRPFLLPFLLPTLLAQRGSRYSIWPAPTSHKPSFITHYPHPEPDLKAAPLGERGVSAFQGGHNC